MLRFSQYILHEDITIIGDVGDRYDEKEIAYYGEKLFESSPENKIYSDEKYDVHFSPIEDKFSEYPHAVKIYDKGGTLAGYTKLHAVNKNDLSDGLQIRSSEGAREHKGMFSRTVKGIVDVAGHKLFSGEMHTQYSKGAWIREIMNGREAHVYNKFVPTGEVVNKDNIESMVGKIWNDDYKIRLAFHPPVKEKS